MIYVSIGGFFGAILRYLLSIWICKLSSSPFPFATFFVNCSGSLALGYVMAQQLQAVQLLLLATGFLGAFTTFSTFSYETIQLMQVGKYKVAVIYVIGSLFISFLFAGIGFQL